jgi:L-aminopeptidase/D-esterase-like protein
VIVAEAGATAGVDVRGGGPGTRETDLLRPENLVQQVQAICLTGGSAFGLAAADGVMQVLEERGLGFPVGGLSAVVPIVPTAVIFDLGRAGSVANRPDPSFGRRATEAAFRRRPVVHTHSAIGAGIGARAGGLQGGIGMASQIVDMSTIPGTTDHFLGSDPIVVSALAVVNAVGSVIDPRTARPWEEFIAPAWPVLRPPSLSDQRRFMAYLTSLSSQQVSPLNTTIGVVATNAPLSKAECSKFAAVAHDGLARAIRPAHSMHDGDTIFGLSSSPVTGLALINSPAVMNALIQAGAETFAIACTRAVINAASVGGPPSYRDLCPSAFGPRGRSSQP